MEWIWTGAYLASEQKGGQGHKLTLVSEERQQRLGPRCGNMEGKQRKEGRVSFPEKRAVVAQSRE